MQSFNTGYASRPLPQRRLSMSQPRALPRISCRYIPRELSSSFPVGYAGYQTGAA